MITSIKFDEKIFEGYSIVKDENLNHLNRINVFIGKNNSGKSRFLRLLLKSKLDVETSKFNTATLNDDIERFRKNAAHYLGSHLSNPTFSHLNQAIYELPKLSYVRQQDSISHLKALLENLFNSLISTASLENKVTVQNIVSASRSRIHHYLGQFKEGSLDYSKTYIPTLRGLRPLQVISSGNKEDFVLSENNYLKRSEVDYELKVGIDIHTGLDLYQKIKEHILGDDESREKLQNFEKYLSKTFFQGDTVHLVSREGKDVLYIKIGKDKQRAIYDLGDGIQAIILLTYPLFFNEGKEILFFMEEPELHLHPGLERVLIETMRDERFNTFQYFVTTHSNHILDLTLEYDDISIYSFQKKTTEKENTFLIQNVSSEHKQVLEQLGVRNSSVFLANCTIWVEGITDRLYLKKYLEVLQKDRKRIFKEDYHYAFIEYGGNNITHWSFLEIDDEAVTTINTEGICSKIFLIVDNDGVTLSRKKKSKKQLRHEQLKEKLEHFYITEGREIENLLSKSIVKKVVQEMEGISRELDFSSFDSSNLYSRTGLGKFIAEKVKGLKSATRYHSTDSKSETISSSIKLTFCKKAVSDIESVDDLSEEAKELGNLILNFIESNNSKTY